MSAVEPIVIANWKMNGSPLLIDQLASAIGRIRAAPNLVLCPPITLLHHAGKYRNLWRLGAQDCHWAASGAYTGSVSAKMLADAGADTVLIGHSERRALGDTDDIVGRKLEAAQAAGLAPVLCVGESRHEREAGLAHMRVEDQLSKCLPVSVQGTLTVAYEPVWAIGTGDVPSDADMSAMRTTIGTWLDARFGPDSIRSIKVVYGGSVTEENVATAVGSWGFDGVLVGGASLSPSSMARILVETTVDGAVPGSPTASH